jgi:hypothetical protein
MRIFCLWVFLAVSIKGNSQAYSFAQVPFSPRLLTGTLIPLVDDAVSGVVPIGFTFCFWGNEYSQAYVGSNGWVGFTAGQPIAFTPFAIPTTNPFIPRNCIMGAFHDMNPGIAGAPPTPTQYVYYRTEGIAPFRRFVVSWANVPMYQCIALRAQQQIVLHETSNVIENTIYFKPICAAWVNGRAIQGLHNANATQAIVIPGRNATTWSVTANNPETYIYVPFECCNLHGDIFGN